MPDVSTFTVDGQKITVKDSTARSSAASAASAASTAQSTANTANSTANANKESISALQKLSRLSVAYDSTTESITFTTGTHA